MFNEDFTRVLDGSVAKIGKVKNKPGTFFISSIMAGMFVCFGLILSITIGGFYDGLPAMKPLMGLTFSAALSLVYFAGSELFTGNVFTLTSGILGNKVSVGDAVKAWTLCYIGNFVGMILISIIFLASNAPSDATLGAVTGLAVAKVAGTPLQLFLKGILCNIMICLATWIVGRTKSESARLIMVVWIILIFFVSGFEHSIANMGIFAMALINPVNGAITMGAALHNLLFVTIGNLVGGALFVSLPYFIISKE